MDTTDVDTRFGDVFPVWFIAGLTDGDMTRPVSLEFGAAVLVHIETLIKHWERDNGCWCLSDDVDRVRYCPACLGVDTNEPAVPSGYSHDIYRAQQERKVWLHELVEAAFKATFANHNIDERVLNHPDIQEWINQIRQRRDMWSSSPPRNAQLGYVGI